MAPSRLFLLPAFVITGSALMAVGITPQPVDAPQNDDYLVEYRMVHEEVDGGADSGVSPDGKWISFSHSKSGNREIYAVSTETGEIKNLTNTPDDDWEGRYSPDGTHIVFTGNRKGQNGVFIRNLETGEETTVMSTKDGYEDYPSFSKDGKMVSFTAGPMGYREVYTWDWATREIRPITRGHNYVGSTNFSADGKKIVYHAYYGGGYGSEKADVFIVDAMGGRGENITHTNDVWVYKAQWSHDGSWIAFSARYDTPNFNLWVMRPDGSDRRKITNVAGEDFRWADWTLDGHLGWHGIKPQQGRLYALDVTTGERHEMVKRDDYIRSLAASPDGSTLLYESGGEIFTTATQPDAEPTMLADGIRPRFSSDGQTVSFLRRRGLRIGMVPIGGGEPVVIEQPVAGWPEATANSWSPDGSTLAVISRGDDGQEVVLISKDGTKRALTSDRHNKTQPVWSADGRFVFYGENRPHRVAYYITNHSVTEMMNRMADTGGQQ